MHQGHVARRGLPCATLLWPLLNSPTSAAPLQALQPQAEAAAGCVEVLDAAFASVGTSMPSATIVYDSCHSRSRGPQRSRVLLSIGDSADSERECRELAHLYQLAKHYSRDNNFSREGFCSAAQDGESGSDSRLEEHEACVASLDAIFTSKTVGNAEMDACVSAQAGKASAQAATALCQKFVAVLEAAPRDGMVDTGRICDALIGSSDVAKASQEEPVNASPPVQLPAANSAPHTDEEHFVESCVQYAENAMTNAVPPKLSLAEHVKGSCEAQLGTGVKGFCAGYASLVQKKATKDELADYCGKEFRAMRGLDAGQQSQAAARGMAVAPQAVATAPEVSSTQAPAQATAAPAAPAATVAPQPVVAEAPKPIATVATIPELPTAQETVKPQPASSDSQVENSDCEKYFEGVRELGLPSGEAAKVMSLDCPRRFSVDADACASMMKLFVAGNSKGACQFAAAWAEPPNPQSQPHAVDQAPKQKAPQPDMGAACRRTVEKVSATGLIGAALERAAADVCSKELTSAAPAGQVPPKLKVRVGCRYLARHLATATAQGKTDPASFCTMLTANHGAGKQTVKPATVPASATTAPQAPPAAPQQPAQSSQAATAVATLAKSVSIAPHQVESAAAATPRSKSDAMSSGVASVSAAVPPEKQRRMQETKRKVEQLFGSDAAAPLAAMVQTAGGNAPGAAQQPAVTLSERRPLATSFVDETQAITTAKAIDAKAQASSKAVKSIAKAAKAVAVAAAVGSEEEATEEEDASATEANDADVDALVATFVDQ
eukprot:TRINITY_DN101952_c0_g1_i1.p1 TRINITY_DN101952_c0_g1~~TRINITY_DN101952_c0_g1_i1.p1  ORF type:complete len:779 (-),score=218.76 TRINITY_DN101952_c0_g1_i1:116-2452(-)